MKITSIISISLSVLASSVFGRRCGRGFGSCPQGQCCSQFGICGITSEYCENTLGCQSNYGSCYASTTNGRCGRNYGRCLKQYQCCSQDGYCGEGDYFCGAGCQSNYGICGNEEMPEDGNVEWVTEYITEYVYKYVEEVNDSRECGPENNCPSGYCCSRYGYCGNTSSFCSVSEGCQPKYGDCYEVVDTAKLINDAECGKGIGSCVNGECCNKDGHCGTSKEFCDIKSGCQKDYGVCNSQSKVGECGEEFGKCPNSNDCCSRSGFCGRIDAYCSLTQGCQPEYGNCINDQEETEEDFYEYEESEESTSSLEPECGKGIGNCPDGKCCSADGTCGVDFKSCNIANGCQKEFGLCNSESPIGRCGKDFGRCPSVEQCCSKEGYCGTTEHYCLPKEGCQELYGKCDPTVSNEFIL